MRAFFFLIYLTISFCAFAASAPQKILVVGDSLSAAYGIDRTDGWVNLLSQRLANQYPGYTIINESITGETTAAGLTILPALLTKHQPQILILELGANDGLQGLPVPHIQQNLSQMIALAQKMQIRILLVGMQLPPNYGTQYTDMFKNMYPALAQQYQIALAPFLLQGVGGYIQYAQQDNIHPTAEAQHIMLENVWPHLKPLLK